MRSMTPLLLSLAAGILFALPGPARAEGPPARGPAAKPAPKATFEVDGAPFEPPVLSLEGDPENPRPGDVIEVDGILLSLGDGPTYRFRTTDSEADGRIYRILPDGREVVAGARTRWTIGKDNFTFVVRNLLEPLTDAEMKGLWGVRLDGWNEAVAAKVACIDPERTCVTLTASCGGPGRNEVRPMPPLPARLRALALDESSSEGLTDLSPLGGQEALRLFATNGFSRMPLDLALLSKCRDLRHLRLGGADLRGVEALASFTALRELDLSRNEGIADAAFARGMTELRRLGLDGTKVADLGPLGALAKLVEVSCNDTPAAILPAGPLPALRNLRVMTTAVKDADAAAFAKSHGKCRVWHRWTEALRTSLKGATRLRLRSGGLCHRDEEEEKTLFEEERPAEVAKILALFEVDEGASGFHCMCCGNPTFEFWKGEELLGSIGFHHGRSARWYGGWPGDGMLSGRSGDSLVDWLAAHGAPEPREERAAEMRRRAAADRMWVRYGEVAGKDLLATLRAAPAEERLKTLEMRVPAAADRGLLAFRLYGCRRGSWEKPAGMDGWLEEAVFPSLGEEAISKAARAAAADPDGVVGLARRLFEERKSGDLDAAALKEVLGPAGRAGLADARPGNRKRTLAALEDLRGEVPVALLREALAGRIEPAPAAAADPDEPEGMVVFRPGGDDGPPEEASLRAAAAWYLAKIGDRASFQAIRELAAMARGVDEKVLAEAAERIRGK